MLAYLSADQLPGKRNIELGFDPRTTVVTGPVGAGKTMMLRDVLFLLTAGRIPSKRTLASLGKKFKATCVLTKPRASLSVVRQNGQSTILETGDTGSSVVQQRLAEFTGMPSEQLTRLCYCSGLTLPATLLTNSELLGLVRSAMGGKVQTAAKLASGGLSDAKAKVQLLEQQLAQTEGDDTQVRADLARAEEDLQTLQAELEGTQESEENARQTMQAVLEDEAAVRIDQLREMLGRLADLPDVDFQEEVRRMPLGGFARQCLDEAAANQADLPRLRAWLPLLCRTAALPDLAGGPAQLCRAKDELKSWLTRPVTSKENRDLAQAYLDWTADLRQQIGRRQQDAAQHRQVLAVLQQMAGLRQQIEADLKSSTALRDLLTDLLTYLQPGGKHSVEKKMTELLFADLMQSASRVCNEAGLEGRLAYSAEDGLWLDRDSCKVPADELSGGELTVAALAVRLAVAERLKPVPFLILDDVTGPLGRLVVPTTEMLRSWSRRTSTQVVVLTHSMEARADHICRIGG